MTGLRPYGGQFREIHPRFLVVAEACVAIREAEEQFAAHMDAQGLEEVFLQVVNVFVIGDRFLQNRLAHLRRGRSGSGKPDGGARNQNRGAVGRQGAGFLHFGRRFAPEFAARRDVALLKFLSCLKHQPAAVPGQRFGGTVRVLRDHFARNAHPPFEGGAVARETGEEIVADLLIETGREKGRRQSGCRKGHQNQFVCEHCVASANEAMPVWPEHRDFRDEARDSPTRGSHQPTNRGNLRRPVYAPDFF